MDPNACVDRINSAMRARDWDETCEAFDDLAGWLRGGGFRPTVQIEPFPKGKTGRGVYNALDWHVAMAALLARPLPTTSNPT